jgi:glycosyltransferase involved in cell wall biosynthesis
VGLKVLYSQQIADNPSKAIRVITPLQQLEKAGLLTAVAIESLGPKDPVAGFDAVFLHLVDLNTSSEPWLLPLLNEALSAGVALICDADDPYFFAADGVAFDDKIAPHLSLMKQLLAAAHLVTVTTVPLKQELSGLARAVVVVPNMIDFEASPRRASGQGKVRVGWCGGPTHADDLAMFLPAMAQLQRRSDVEFVIFGMFDRNFEDTVQRARKLPKVQREKDQALASFGRMADALKGVRYEHVPSVAYPEFPARLAALNFDIGVCPLLDTRFNRCRSAVKFYQYAAAGTVTVASDVASYQNECNQLASNTTASWLGKLEPLVNNGALRESTLAEQSTYVRNNRSWPAGLALYQQLFDRMSEAAKRGRRV